MARHSRAFAYSLVVSALFHLSMVSVFSIVIYFPRRDAPYYAVRLVEQRPDAPAARGPVSTVPRETLRVPSPDRLLEDGRAEDAAGPGLEPGPLASLPPIELPRLEFPDLERIRTREESLRIRSQYSDLFAREPRDSWARFGEELRGLTSALTRWTLPGTAEPRSRPVRVSTPAPGFALYIEWMSEPRDRKVLFSPPVQALWNLEPAAVAEPIALVFTANPQGKVTEVQIPVEDDAGVVAAIARALLRYRFEPLEGEETRDQKATLLVTAETSAE